MGGCVSSHKDVDGSTGKCYKCLTGQRGRPVRANKSQICKSRKGRGKTVTPISGASVAERNKEINGFGHTPQETTINSLGRQSTEESVISHPEPESGTLNVHVNEKSPPRRSSCVSSKEERFFDSLGYLESDAEEDFQTVNGDTIHSMDNTLGYLNSNDGTPRPSVTSLKERMAKVEDWDKGQQTTNQIQVKKKLKEFFKEKLSMDGGLLDYVASTAPVVNDEAACENVHSADTSVDVRHDSIKSNNHRESNGENNIKKSPELKDQQKNNCCFPQMSRMFP